MLYVAKDVVKELLDNGYGEDVLVEYSADQLMELDDAAFLVGCDYIAEKERSDELLCKLESLNHFRRMLSQQILTQTLAKL